MKVKLFLLSLIISLIMVRGAFAGELLTFEGQVDFSKNELDFVVHFPSKDKDIPSKNVQEEILFSAIPKGESQKLIDEGGPGFVVGKVEKTPAGGYHFSLNIERLKTPVFELSTEIESDIKLRRDKNDLNEFLSGRIWSQYSLVDYRPLKELSGQFEIKDNTLYLSSLSLGNVSYQGSVKLEYPYPLDLTLALTSVKMNDFLNFWIRKRKYDSQGDIFGEIAVSGNLNRLLLKGNLESRNGFIDKLEFDRIRLNIEGTYPHMQIAHSMISQSDGLSFTLDGRINLDDRKNFRKQIKALNISPLVVESGSELEWTIKRFEPHESGTIELKYLRRKGDETGASTEEESDMLGIERTMEF